MSTSLSESAARRDAGPRRPAHASLARRRNRAALWFVLPGFALFTVFVLYPIVSSIWLSFHHWDGMTPMTFAGLDNYRELLQSDTFTVALKNNVLWLVLFLAAPPLGLALALYLNQSVFGIRLVKSLFFAPFVLPGVVVGLVFSWFYDPTFGLLKLIVGHGIPVLGDPRYATYGVIAAALWPQIPFCMILYLTGLTGINGEIVEAARMEGARGFTLLWHVILPQLRPATFMAVVLTVIGALRSFDLISVMTGGGPFDSSTVLAYFMVDQAIKYYREGYSAAIAVVLFAIMLVYIVWQLRKLVRVES
ncbi:carbohydrate ABC transporter permease [Burkholderia cenocepacia]|uniref:carbohydrate ABC transporter permease n=1 Tax=Burkholderia cenocepacia TaxID=95486 RepID=UPI00222E480D|nr:sugar ABC transporter permease [Burkholderia cenocepacia]MCW3501093.1 sugar ABC transporter permease [Burkholderia cenocepacia]MCW3508657.1 sugar ABC transporter permease [Burkholderia cenocepacia]MCW3516243.1 sugar ABC transporter permease [Burkholderia cenocepacia]MCW3531393.1 sugar ABC transporter permease [Burkholderia cenocepacia]MCW3546461.1 sugar ABC transporter permease [Burkholderia cenocepacia]